MNLAPVVLVSYALVWAAHSQSTETFWNDYPPCERQCHQSVYGNQSCTLQNNCACSGCLCLADSCLCETDSWLIAVSHCIGQECGAAAVTEAASIASSGCDSHSLTLAVSPQSLIQAGLSAVSTSTSPGTSTSSSTSSVVSNTRSTAGQTEPVNSATITAASSGHSSFSGRDVALAVGLIGGFVILALCVGGLLLRRRLKEKQKRRRDPRNLDGRSQDAYELKYQPTVPSRSTIGEWAGHVHPGIPHSESNFLGITKNPGSDRE